MPSQPSTGIGLGRAPLRIAGLYASFGLIWIWLSDWLFIWLGYTENYPLLASAIKGTVFVVITAMLLHWLIRREIAVAQKSETLLRAVVEGTTDAVFVKDCDGRYLLANEAAARFIGRPVGEVLGRDDIQLFGTADAERLIANDRSTMAGGKVVNHEETITSGGEKRTYHATKAPFRDATGAVAGLIGVSRDMTERKEIEDALRLSEQQYRELANAIPQIVWTARPDGAVTHLNTKAVEYTGVAVADLVGWSWKSVIHPDDLSQALNEWSLALKSGVPRPFEMRIQRTDGEYRWHIVRQLPIRNSKSEIDSWVGTCTDIDDLKQTKNALRETDDRLREAQRIAKLGSWNWEPQTDKVSWSDAEFELFGLEPGSIHPSFEEFLALLHPDDRQIALARVEAMRTGASEIANDMRIIRPDGQCIWIHSRARATRDANGQILRVEGTDQDITARMLSEEALRVSESRYRLMFESNPYPMWVYNVDSFSFLAVNDAAVLAYGYSREEFLAMGIRDIRPQEDVPNLESVVARLTPGRTHSYIWRHRRKDGTVINVDIASHDLPDNGGRARLVMALNVTERLRIEEARDELLARLQLHIDRMPIAYVLFDDENRYSNWNPAAEKIFGYSRDEIIGQSHQLLVHPEDRIQVEAISGRLRTGDVTAHSINRNVTKDGRVIICEWHNTPLFSPNGAFLGVLSMTLDITDRVRAEEALRESDRRLRLALEAAGAIAFTWDIRNDTVTRYFSTEPTLSVTVENLGTLNEVRAQIHPEDLAGFDGRLQACISAGSDYRNQFRVVRADGSSANLEEFGYLDRDTDGSPLFLSGISIDISDRTVAMQALQSSEARYRQLVDLLPAAVFVHADDEILYGNPAFLRMMGAANLDQVLGRSPFDVAHESAHESIRRRQEEMTRTGEAVPGFEMLMLRLDGRPVLVFSVAAPIDDYGRSATLVVVTDLTERERATQLLRSVLSSVDDAIITIDETGVIHSVNPATVRQFGYAEDELIGQNVSLLMYKPFTQEHEGYLFSYLKTGIAKIIGIGREVECRRSDETRFPAELTVTEFSLEGERRFTGVLRDITERQRLQTQFMQAQKMEAVGRLAGGVAHDFNNLLTIISGYCELLLMSDFPVGDKRRDSIATIRDAGERAARLTQQLLAFSRKALIEPKLIDLNELVSDSVKLLRRLIGEDIILAVVTAPKPIPIKADPGQFEQVIMNLVVNARDAMPIGGRLTIETSVITSTDPGGPLLACLAVSDTGQGVSDEVKEKIFEPFFTTKGVGKGTGLGLAVVHGVVTQSGGQITIESSIGVGTTFRIVLPMMTDSTSNHVVEPARFATRGTETVLLVEDDNAVRRITRISLQAQGYTILEASDGMAGLHQAETYPGEIHLLISDVVMPEMGGRQLLDAVRRHRPGLRVLFMSGYTDDAVLLHGVVEAADAFIQKPFTPLSLARKVREVIDAT